MSSALISLFVAAGVAAFVYSRMGRRIGYGQQQSVFKLVAITFVLSFIAVFIIAKTIIPS